MIAFLSYAAAFPSSLLLLRPLLRRRGWSEPRLQLFSNRAFKLLLLSTTISYAPLSGKLLELLACRSIDGLTSRPRVCAAACA